MLEEPSEDKIESLLQMGVVPSRDEAIRRLKANGNDIERTIEAIFVPIETHQQQQQQNNVWENLPFNGNDRNGHIEPRTNGEDPWMDMDGGLSRSPTSLIVKWQANTNLIITPGFAIHHAPDNLHPDAFEPPTRPPSRAERETIDLTREHAAATPSISISAADYEEADLKRALDISRSEMTPQESGVAHFGPATRVHYNNNEWALTTVGSGAHEIYPNPEPIDRKRIASEPAFLKPSPSSHTLASFLTILHSIPLARRALLCQDHLLSDYGYNDEWWDGTPAKAPRVVRLDDGIRVDRDEDEVIFETQRLVAFLTKTTRAYGSAETLANIDGVSNQHLDVIIGDFLAHWYMVAKRVSQHNTLPEIFRTVAISYSEEGDRKVQPVFLPGLNVDESQTLYDIIDDALWSEVDEDKEEAFFEQAGEVFSMLLKSSNGNQNGLGIRIPAVLYLDRYMESSESLAKEMRLKKAEMRRKILEMERLEARLTETHSSNIHGGPFDPRKLLQAAVSQFTVPMPPKQPNGVYGGDAKSEYPSQEHQNGNADIAQKLKQIYKTVLEKLKALEEQKEKAKASLQELSTLLTQPSDDPENSPQMRYTLRGVTTLPHITYVLLPISEGETGNTPDAISRGQQWWKINFSTDARSTKNVNSYYVSSSTGASVPTGGDWDITEPPSWGGDGQVAVESMTTAYSGSSTSWAQKIPEVQVLKAAREESQSVILVYASDRAMKAPYPSLPPPLEKFVEIDNAAFAAELGSAQQPATSDHRSPKRKASWNEEEMVPWGGETPSRARADGEPSPELHQDVKDAVDTHFAMSTDRVHGHTTPPLPTLSNTRGGTLFSSIDEVEIASPQEHDNGGTSEQPEMTERSHLSPVARAFKPMTNIVTINLSERGEDDLMGDVDGDAERVEFTRDVTMM
ncbi:hypothetical protein FGG08_004802 [Glutinoglossum americanum]|uniref:UBA domain-containing protein n=1 Tax=Glutinoglossum americanum TaxID=1670608 RepID=A0A9P8HZQ5_9PEZI|nr:hypothetical protein FGG08_004802 [Glutinoglossum americanum]